MPDERDAPWQSPPLLRYGVAVTRCDVCDITVRQVLVVRPDLTGYNHPANTHGPPHDTSSESCPGRWLFVRWAETSDHRDDLNELARAHDNG